LPGVDFPRDYKQVVMDSHFPEGWLAPKQVTTQNAYIVGDTTFTNGTEVSPLLGESFRSPLSVKSDSLTEISMSKTNSWDPTWYATSTLGESAMSAQADRQSPLFDTVHPCQRHLVLHVPL
jgi:hypothetical protein